MKMGEQWEQLRDYFHQFDIVIGLCLALAVGYFLWSHWPRRAAHSWSRKPPMLTLYNTLTGKQEPFHVDRAEDGCGCMSAV